MQISSKTLALKLTKTPSDGSGTFEAIVAGWDIDHDNERFDRKAFDSVDPEKPYPLHYHHMPSAADPGATIGMVFAKVTDAGLRVVGQLDLKNPMAQAVHERMLLPKNDPQALHEFSVGFEFDPTKTYTGEKGETVIPAARLVEVSVVYKGAQRTELLSIKNAAPRGGHAATQAALTSAANHLAQSAVDALRGGLFEEQQALQAASRDLRLLAGGSTSRTLEDILAAVKPIVASLLAAGRSVGADNLATTLAELDTAYQDGKAAALDAPAVQGDALEMFGAMKRDLIKTFPQMARDVFGELTNDEKAAVRQKKLRERSEDQARVQTAAGGGIVTKSSADAPVGESALPVFDERFRVVNPPAPIPTDEPETVRVEQNPQPEDDDLNGVRVIWDGS